jgi:DNA recombination protein RmuC
VASFEGRVLVSARRFKALNFDTGNSVLDSIDSVDVVAKAPAVELLPPAAVPEAPEAEAAE